jgi:hypothetical protein
VIVVGYVLLFYIKSIAAQVDLCMNEQLNIHGWRGKGGLKRVFA